MSEASAPPELTVRLTPRGFVVRARAGTFGWPALLALILAAAWSVGWGTALARVIRQGPAGDAGPALFFCGAAFAAGLYATLLSLWSFIGHETLILDGLALRVSNPWLFGFPTKRFDLARVGPFLCQGRDCGVQAEGCCCRWSAVDYTLSFDTGPGRLSVFPQISRGAKDWLRERLEAARRDAQAS